MESNFKLCGLLLLILGFAQVSRAQLKCYVCENCEQVNAHTPLLDCDEDFFDGGGSNEPSTQTTTGMPSVTTEMSSEMPSTSSTTSESTSTVSTTESTTTTTTTTPTTTTSTTESAMPLPSTTETTTTENNATSTSNSSSTSTNVVSPSSTTEQIPVTTESTMDLETTTTEGTATTATNTTTNMDSNSTLTSLSSVPTTSTTTTEDQPPTPSTAHPPSLIPTPPNPSAAIPVDDIVKYVVNGTETDHASTKPYIVSSQFRLRQTRAVSDYTYHCYKVTASANGAMTTNRGCSRVKTSESVCGQWKEQHPMEQLNKCHPCSNTRCNGSSALNLSLGALALTLVAAALQRK